MKRAKPRSLNANKVALFLKNNTRCSARNLLAADILNYVIPLTVTNSSSSQICLPLAKISVAARKDLVSLLNISILGVADYELIADHFRMSPQKIDDLKRRQNPGQHVLSYIMKKNPRLLTEEFASILEGPAFKRKDIAELLRKETLTYKQGKPHFVRKNIL